MNTLNGLALPDQLIWAEQFMSKKIAGTMVQTLDGGVIIGQQALKFMPITLEAREDTAWFTDTDVQTLLAMDTPGAMFSLVWEGTTYSCVARHDQPPAFEFTPIFPFNTYFTGRIKLLQL